MNEAWLDQDYKVFSYEPQPAGTVRVNYYRTDGNYDKKSLWYWGDVKKIQVALNGLTEQTLRLQANMAAISTFLLMKPQENLDFYY